MAPRADHPADLPPVRYQRSPHLVAHWRESKTILRNYATRVDVHASSMVLDVVAATATWLTAAEVGAAVAVPVSDAATFGKLETLLDRLVEFTVLRRSDAAPAPADRAMEAWREWNPAAGFFHGATKDVVFVEDDVGGAKRHDTTRRVRSVTAPVPVAGASVVLPAPQTRGALPGLLRRRRTWRRFVDRPVTEKALSSLLWWTAGVQGWLLTPAGEKLPLKSSPSAGSRHPIDLHVLIRNVSGVDRGFYRYDPERHRLIANGRAGATDIREYLPRQYWYQRAAVVVFLCARFARTFERYKFPRAYRAIATEAGHVCQTFCLVATSLGLAPFSTMALAEDAIDRDLGLDGIGESVLYAAGAGVPPSSGLPAAPMDVKGARIRPHRVPRGGT